MGGGGRGIACPGFSVLRFRREFLSRMRIPKGNRTRMSGLARFGMDADRGRPQPMVTCTILLRNSQPEKVHGKPGQAIPLPPPPKKLPPVRPPINITFQAELLRQKPKYNKTYIVNRIFLCYSFSTISCQVFFTVYKNFYSTPQNEHIRKRR